MRLCCQETIKKKRERKKRKKIKTIQQAMKDLMNIEVQNVKVKDPLGKTIKILRVLIMNFG